MVIGPITSIQTAPRSERWRPPAAAPAMTATARLLGLSTDELAEERAAGATLLQLGLQRGIARDRLLAGVAVDLRDARAPEAMPLSQEELTQVAARVADGRDPMESTAHVALMHATETRSTAFVDIASWLGLDPKTLLGSLEDGVSLSEVAARQGTSASAIVARLGGATSAVVDTWA